MLEGLMKGLALWIYDLLLEIVEFIADSLLEVFNMDLAYFEANVPVTQEIVTIIIAAGWAILIGNLAFQSLKTMMSGIGFEGEDPKILFCRTFVFSFLLLASHQICEIGLGMTAYLNTLLQTPDAVRLDLPPLDVFAIPGSWLLVMIIGLVLMAQIVKFFFEIAERYVVLVMLTILAPLAFGVGGSKNTEDIFKGWARMYGSACLMMLFNTVFLKLLLSAMSNIPSGLGMLPWLMLVVAIARVARKIDDIVSRIGLNIARTGDPIGKGGVMYPIMVAKSLTQLVSKTASSNRTATGGPGIGWRPGNGGTGASPPPPSPPSSPSSGGTSGLGGGGVFSGNTAPHGHRGKGSASAPENGNATQPAMSVSSPSGTAHGKEPPPSRPPIGSRREQATPGDTTFEKDQQRRRSDAGRPPLSADSPVPDGVSSGRTGKALRNTGVASENPYSRPGAPSLSADSRRPNTPKQGSPNRSQQSNRKANIDIFRDDEPSGSVSPGPGVRGSRPVSTSENRTPPPPPSSASQSRTIRHGGNHTHTAANAATIQNPIRNMENPAERSVGSKSIAPPSSQVSSPMAGRVGRGTGGRSGGVTMPGGAQRAPSIQTGQQRSSVPAAGVPPTTSKKPSPHGITTSIRSGVDQSKQSPPPEAQPPRSRPVRYRMVDRAEGIRPKGETSSSPDSPSKYRSDRPAGAVPKLGGEAK